LGLAQGVFNPQSKKSLSSEPANTLPSLVGNFHGGYHGGSNVGPLRSESMGALVDRSKEYLGASDVIITLARRQLLKAVREYQASGSIPFIANDSGLLDYNEIRSLSIKVPAGTAWKDLDPFNPPLAEAAE